MGQTFENKVGETLSALEKLLAHVYVFLWKVIGKKL
jgi:hypothetical protein